MIDQRMTGNKGFHVHTIKTFTDPLILTLGSICRWSRDSMLNMTRLRSGRSRDLILAGPSGPPLGLPRTRIQWLPGALFPDVKQQGRGLPLTLSSAPLTNEWSYTTTFPICFHGLYCDITLGRGGGARCRWSVRHTARWFSGTHSRVCWVGLRAGLAIGADR
jgi:hypothetical protein